MTVRQLNEKDKMRKEMKTKPLDKKIEYQGEEEIGRIKMKKNWYNKIMKWNGMSIKESIDNVLTFGQSQSNKRIDKIFMRLNKD